jgi:hypothetical protein
VDEKVDLRDADARLGERLLHDLHDRVGRCVRRRQRLADGDDAFLADEAEVGERAADVDADAVQAAVSITRSLRGSHGEASGGGGAFFSAARRRASSRM